MNLGFGDLVSKDGKIDFEIVGDKRKNMTLSEIEEKTQLQNQTCK